MTRPSNDSAKWRNLQVRLTKDIHEMLKEVALDRGVSIADVIREALEVYGIGLAYAQDGKRLIWEDPASGSRTEVLIPGFSARFAPRQLTATAAEIVD